MRTRRPGIVAVATMLALTGAACSGDGGSTGGSAGDTSGGGGASAGGSADQTVTIEGFAFHPATLTISGSTTVEVVNQDDTEHSFTLDDDSVSQDVQGGESETVTIDPGASIGWHCEFHPDMKGTITVT